MCILNGGVHGVFYETISVSKYQINPGLSIFGDGAGRSVDKPKLEVLKKSLPSYSIFSPTFCRRNQHVEPRNGAETPVCQLCIL
jgi:hypothetical protein